MPGDGEADEGDRGSDVTCLVAKHTVIFDR